MMDFRRTILFIGILSYLTVCETLAVEGEQNACTVSLIIPRESIKSTCAENQFSSMKMKSIESQLTHLRRSIGELQVKLTSTISRSASPVSAENVKDMMQRIMQIETISIPNLERKVELADKKKKAEAKGNTEMAESMSKRSLLRLIRQVTKKEIASMKDQIREEIRNELLEDFATTTKQKSKYKRDKTSFSHSNIDTDMNSVTMFKKRNRFEDDDFFQEQYFQNGFDQRLERLARLVAHDTTDSAIDNEVPEDTEPEYVQADGQFNYGMNKIIFDNFRNEMTTKLNQQTERVKTIVNKQLNVAENKITQMLTIIESMKSEYDKKLEEIGTNVGEHGLNAKVEQIETDVVTLATGISSLRENFFSDPQMQNYFKQEQLEVENKIMAKFAKSSSQTRIQMESLQKQVDLQSAVQMSMQNQQRSDVTFRADTRVNLHFMENNITQILDRLQAVNASLNPDYEEQFDLKELEHQADITNTINFVENVRNIWPYIVGNLTYIEDVHQTDLEETHQKFTKIETKIEILKQNQTMLEEQIRSVKNDIERMEESLIGIEKKNKEKAMENNEWVQEDFKFTYGRSGCHGGKQYVKKTGYKTAAFVGVALCSHTRYKIYLSASLDDTFLDIGDRDKFGEDHCEFVGATKDLTITVGKSANQWDKIPGFKRADWGEIPIKGTLSFMSPTPPWYECGVTIP